MLAVNKTCPRSCARFAALLRCGVLDHGFLRVVCEQCHAERLLSFSCKKRGFCPSRGAGRMAESARHVVEEVFGPRPVRQCVLSVSSRPLRGNALVARCAFASPLRRSLGPLRLLFASKPEAICPVLGIVTRVIAGWLADQAGVERSTAQCGAVTLIQCFGSALNLNIHFHLPTFTSSSSTACASRWPPGRISRACAAPARRRPRS